MSDVPTGDDWIEDVYVTPIGHENPIRRARVPEITLSLADVDRVSLYDSPWQRAFNSEAVVAQLEVTPDAAANFRATGRERPGF